ncbi:tRNAHis guanylyltransferase-domain-containing protein [Dendryphion nanum]|uniref:tRNA(His) guanylyltransferase n=1 Tax=Dendryphion nanum TaxID=256645 RepID=A0A9P9D4D7_9PLEO|nr:tRNAHis guanylyltransferase-domain-containing protein [Dendryphion nanum]
MANSKYEYVRSFEQPDSLLTNTWIVVRIDGRGFSKFTTRYQFEKPNDRRALDLMNAAAEAVMKDLPDLVLAYGNSDEFSFVFHKDCVLFERRASKLMTTITSTFTAQYTYLWSTYFPNAPLTPPLPSFDGRCVCYPSDQNLRDYMSWRQVDCHINNLYNTTFWSLVNKGGMHATEAEKLLKGTVSSDKNEILFSRFSINYNNEPEIFKKGSVLYRDFFPVVSQSSPTPVPKPASPPPLSHPQPRRQITRPMSQPLERTVPNLLWDSPESDDTPRGPTFLSTSTTPSPPPSPPSMSIPSFQPQPFAPITNLTNGGHSHSSSLKSPFPLLTPLPLPPPTLKPSTRPPPSLHPPNPTTHTNTSPLNSPQTDQIPKRSSSNSSKRPPAPPSYARPTASSSATPSNPKPNLKLKNRSPSLGAIDYTFSPPIIPLRISSIPINNKTRKLSLPSQKSISAFHQKCDEKENKHPSTPPKSGSPMSTMKEMPSPPPVAQDDVLQIRNKVMGGEFETMHVDIQRAMINPTSPTSSRPRPSRRARSSSHLHSAPASTYFPPSTSPSPDLKPKTKTKSKSTPNAKSTTAIALSASPIKSGKAKAKVTEEGGWAAGTMGQGHGNEGRPVEMSRTQREKERKKRGKARIVIEHVDVIKDEFWVKRPWILSGRAG